MSVWFTSDLHLGNPLKGNMGKHRPYQQEEWCWFITENINEYVHKRDKLFILGDSIDTDVGFKWAKSIRCQNIELILGNHDKYQIYKYLNLGWKIHGFRVYQNYWLSHCPIHPFEIRRKKANIHGHIHIGGDTQKIEDPRYFCVNPEFHKFKPVSFDEIEAHYKED